jgi:hypothetical protein
VIVVLHLLWKQKQDEYPFEAFASTYEGTVAIQYYIKRQRCRGKMMPNMNVPHVWFVFMVQLTGIVLSAFISLTPASCPASDAITYPQHWKLEVDGTQSGNFTYKKLSPPPHLRITDKHYQHSINLQAYHSSLSGTPVDLPTDFVDATSFSISFWILGKSRGPVISMQSNSGDTKPLWIFIDRTGRLLFNIETKTTSYTIRSKNTPFAADSESWFHVVFIKTQIQYVFILMVSVR